MYDLMVISIEQQNPINLTSQGSILVDIINKDPTKKGKFYYNIWPLINNISGIMYQIYCDDELKQFKACNGLFSFVYDSSYEEVIPYWKVEEDNLERLYEVCVPMVIKDKYYLDFCTILDKLIESSPLRSIMFLCRVQSYDDEVIYGSIKKDSFNQMLLSKKVYTNICYIITG